MVSACLLYFNVLSDEGERRSRTHAHTGTHRVHKQMNFGMAEDFTEIFIAQED
jgi:hypothetical protein